MSVRELVLRNRSYRRFHEEKPIDRATLLELVDLARNGGSAANRQPLKYLLSWERERNARIFPQLGWAGYIEDWAGPTEGERPSAYVVILGDKLVAPHFHCDHGIAAQSMLLGAVERGLGGCIIASIRREDLRKELSIPEHLEILLVLALGTPAETVVLEPLGEEGDIRYWRDADGVHHVPKRSLDEILLD